MHLMVMISSNSFSITFTLNHLQLYLQVITLPFREDYGQKAATLHTKYNNTNSQIEILGKIY